MSILFESLQPYTSFCIPCNTFLPTCHFVSCLEFIGTSVSYCGLCSACGVRDTTARRGVFALSISQEDAQEHEPHVLGRRG